MRLAVPLILLLALLLLPLAAAAPSAGSGLRQSVPRGGLSELLGFNTVTGFAVADCLPGEVTDPQTQEKCDARIFFFTVPGHRPKSAAAPAQPAAPPAQAAPPASAECI